MFFFAFLGLLFYASIMLVKSYLHPKTTLLMMLLHLLSALIAIVSYAIFAFDEMIISFWLLIGLTLVALGLLINVFAFKALRSQAFDPGKSLITSGIYGQVRNPMYSGIMLAAYGSFLFSFSAYALLYCVLVTFLLYLVVFGEEAYLAKTFGKKFISYQVKVPRFLP
ncbi:MAG: methyltransferase [Candidatus Woesearchaeota archaeon]